MQVNSFSLLLRKAADSPSDDMSSLFGDIAQDLFCRQILVAGELRYRIIDVEFYYFQNHLHADSYSHYAQYPNSVRDKQSVIGGWYFHRYRAMATYTHTRRGLDLTFGNIDKKTFGGILLRGIIRQHDGYVIKGPSNVVGEFIRMINEPEVVHGLAHTTFEGAAFDRSGKLYFENGKPIPCQMRCIPRHGLSDKDPVYRDKLYRYTVVD